MPRMRILHVVARSHRRGAEIVAMELAAELDLLGHDNRVVALGLAHDGGRIPSLPPLVPRVDEGIRELVLGAVRLRRRVRRESVDVVLVHGGWAAQVAVLAVPRRGPLVVWQLILGFPDKVWRPARRTWWRLVLRRVDGAFSLTEELKDEVRRLHFPGPVWVVPNSRRPDRFLTLDRAAESRRLRKEAGVGPDVELVGFVGHLVAQKRPERAVELLGMLRERGRPAHLVMAGGGPLAAAVAREVAARGLREHVTMLGHRDDVERVLAGVDLVVLTSDTEGIPGVAIEAQMAGSPLVTFPLGGVGEVVEHDVTGVVLDSHDVKAMADAVEALLLDRPRLARMSEQARSRTPEFSASRTARTYADRLGDLRSGALASS